MIEDPPPEQVVRPTSKCEGCGKEFPSRNAVFKHLKETDGSCLSKDDYKDFIRYVRKSVKPPKVILLYGYLPFSSQVSLGTNNERRNVRDGQDAGNILMEAISKLQDEIDEFDDDANSGDNASDDVKDCQSTVIKLNRSYGHFSRSAECVQQDSDTSAITEVMTARLFPLRGDMTMNDWLDRVQRKLDAMFQQGEKQQMNSDDCFVTPVQILGRQDMPNKKFNAEMDVTYRRIEYLLPVDFLTWSMTSAERKQKIDNLPIFAGNHKHDIDHVFTERGPSGVNESTRLFMLELKNYMKLLTTRIEKVDSTEISVTKEEIHAKNPKDQKGERQENFAKKSKKRARRKQEPKARSNQNPSVTEGEKTEENRDHSKGKKPNDNFKKDFVLPKKAKKTNVLKRKRYHNFTAKSMAHEYLTYRRMDRIYHRATLRYPCENSKSVDTARKDTTYLALSISGDLFLTGQICRVVGVLLALINGVVDPEFVDCVFDENYPHLIPTPSAPLHGMVSCEVHYANQEGKTKRILSPRVSKRFSQGWCDVSTLRRVKDWQSEVYRYIDNQWKRDGWDEDGRLRSQKNWTKDVLLPWASKAQSHLEEYRAWKKNREQPLEQTKPGHMEDKSQLETPQIQQSISIDPTVPELYGVVLSHLRKLDASGEWPTTSSKRQLVMISTDSSKDKNQQPESLTMACTKASQNIQTNSSAYSFAEGQGGASGSFSVGIMPGGVNKQPKANSMFPELVQAAFDLEVKLCPEREPSSTIAINRNAQFRPHTDSGAGAGQSTSLIVGLGTYSGGELMVEGEKHDIRYKAIEFNGWKQRHWTMPFKGERFSLVWFTPKGCEGMRGIDLYSK